MRCGKVLVADTLEKLSAMATKCCKKKPGKKPVAVAPPRPLTLTLPYTIRIDRPMKSSNQWQWKPWYVYNNEKKAWFKLLSVLAVALQGVRLDYSKWKLVRHYTMKQKVFDHANLVGGAKPIPDALKHIGAIKDDSPKHFDCEYVQVQDGESYTELILLEGRHDPQTTDI